MSVNPGGFFLTVFIHVSFPVSLYLFFAYILDICTIIIRIANYVFNKNNAFVCDKRCDGERELLLYYTVAA